MNCSTPGLPVHHQLPEFTQTHAHRVGDAIQPKDKYKGKNKDIIVILDCNSTFYFL